jgi:hypothetical protein
MMAEERQVKSDKRVGRREAVRARAAIAKLEEERLKENDRIISQRQHANGELPAQKAAQQAIMMMKQEALNVAFGHGVVIPLGGQGHAVAGASLVPSGRPPVQPRPHMPSQGGGHDSVGCALSRLGVPGVMSLCTSGKGIDLNHTPTTGRAEETTENLCR